MFHRVTLFLAFCLSVNTQTKAASPPVMTCRHEQAQVLDALKKSGAEQLLKDFAADPVRFPGTAEQVMIVAKNSKAEKLGIVPRSLLLLRGTQEYFGQWKFLDPEKNTETMPAGDLVFITPDGTVHAEYATEGPLGLTTLRYRNLAFWYLSYGKRDARWDSHVVAALLAQPKDVAMAESHWSMAQEAGYKPDPLYYHSGLMYALSRRDHINVIAWAEQLLDARLPEVAQDFPINPDEFQEVCSLTGEIRWLKKYENMLQGRKGMDSRSIEVHERLENELPMRKLSPSEMAASMKRVDFIRDAKLDKPLWADLNAAEPLMKLANDAHAAGKLEFEEQVVTMPTGKFLQFWLAPKSWHQNLDVEFRFRVEAVDLGPEGSCEFERFFQFGLRNFEAKPGSKNSYLLAAGCTFQKWDLVDMHHWFGTVVGDKKTFGTKVSPFSIENQKKTNYNWSHRESWSPRDWHTIRIVKVGDFAEALMDGKRMCITRCDPAFTKPGVYIHICGCIATFTALRADYLE